MKRVKGNAPEIKKETPAQAKARRAREMKEKAKYREWERRRAADAAKERARILKAYPLPDGLSAADLTPPKDKDRLTSAKEDSLGLHDMTLAGGWASFDIWYTQAFGWVAPTLGIRGAGRGGFKPRTYAVALKDHRLVRVGQGPHVLASIRIHVKASNFKRLEPVIATIRQGSVDANETRDRISTRMARRRRTFY